MSPDRRKDDDNDNPQYLSWKQKGGEERVKKLLEAQREAEAQAQADEEAQLAKILAGQARIAQEEIDRRRKDSMRVVEKVRASQAPQAPQPAAEPEPEQPAQPVIIEPAEPPLPPQKANFGPLLEVMENAGQAIEEKLEKSKEIRNEAFRFMKFVVRLVGARERLEAKLRKMINKPEYVSEVITIAIQIEQISTTLRRLEDYMLHSMDMSKTGTPQGNVRNINGLRTELGKAGDEIGRTPSHPPSEIGYSEDPGLDTTYMMPDDSLVAEFAEVKMAVRAQDEGNDFDHFFGVLEQHWKNLIETTAGKVAIDTGRVGGVISKLERQLTMLSRLATRGPLPLNARNKWAEGLNELAEMIGHSLTKIDSLYTPTYKDLLRRIDRASLDREYNELGDKLREIEVELLNPRENDPSLLEIFRRKVGGVVGRQPVPFRTRRELEVEKSRLSRRKIRVRELMRLKDDLDNREDD